MERREESNVQHSIVEGFPRADSSVGADPPRSPVNETVLSVLATRARSHSRTHLALAASIGVADAVVLGWAHPHFWPIAALFAAAGAYASWGLVDRALSDRPGGGPFATPTKYALRISRVITGVAGILLAIAALGGIWDAALGGWRH